MEAELTPLAQLEAETIKKLDEAQTTWQVDQIMKEADAAKRALLAGVPTLPEAIASHHEYEKRQKAYDKALSEAETPADVHAFMQANIVEASLLADAERRFESPEDVEALEKIGNASREELDALTNSEAHQSRQAQQEYLTRRGFEVGE